MNLDTEKSILKPTPFESEAPWKWLRSRRNNPYIVIRGKHNATITVFLRKDPGPPDSSYPLGWTFCVAHKKDDIFFSDSAYDNADSAKWAARKYWDRITKEQT